MNNIEKLGLSTQATNQVKSIIEDSKMEWECWIESAESFAEIKAKLAKRGYKGFSMTDKSEIKPTTKVEVNQDAIKRLPNQNTMMRKNTR